MLRPERKGAAMEKKDYEKLELEVVRFETGDVITTSWVCTLETPDIP